MHAKWRNGGFLVDLLGEASCVITLKAIDDYI